MKRKLVALGLCLIMVLSLVGCSKDAAGTTAPQKSAEAPKYKIGIMTGTVSQGEEPYRAAEKMKAKYGNMVIHQTYPDKFTTEQETTVSTAMSIASDPDTKAIIFMIGVVGTAAAMDKIRQARPDILLMAGTPGDDPAVIAKNADIVYQPNIAEMGTEVAEAAAKMGAKTLVHYSFPRHMSQQVNISRRDKMKAASERLGLKFVEGTSPDPMSDAGVAGTQQFMLEDIPRKVKEYGKDTAFFGTNAGMQDAMCKAVIETGAIYPHPDNPSPYNAYPAALGISIPDDKKADLKFIMAEISKRLAEKNMSGRAGTWSVPLNLMQVEAAFMYAREFCEGRTNGKVDAVVFKKVFEDYAGGPLIISNYKNVTTGEAYKNFFEIIGNLVIFK
jgi:hypothetical protein